MGIEREDCNINIDELNKFFHLNPSKNRESIKSITCDMSEKFIYTFETIFNCLNFDASKVYNFYEYNYDDFYVNMKYAFNKNIGEQVSTVINVLETFLFPKIELTKPDNMYKQIWLLKPHGDEYIDLEMDIKEISEGLGAGNKRVTRNVKWIINFTKVYEIFTPSETILIEGVLDRLKKAYYIDTTYDCTISSVKKYHSIYDFYVCRLLRFAVKYWLSNKFDSILRACYGNSLRDTDDDMDDLKIYRCKGAPNCKIIETQIDFDHIPAKDLK